MQKCLICKKNLEFSFFYKNHLRKSGYSNKCKECEILVKREQRIKHPVTYKKKDTAYYQKNKKKVLDNRMRWYHKNKDKILAHEKVKRALFNGTLLRKSCEKCGNSKSVAHHDDYSKPLEVRWLCARCHMRLHHGKS